MKWTFALKPQDQSARLRHFSRVIFNGLTRLKRLRNISRGNIALKHTLNGMHPEDDFGCIHLQLFLLLTRRETVRDRIRSIFERRTDAIMDRIPVVSYRRLFVLSEFHQPLHEFRSP